MNARFASEHSPRPRLPVMSKPHLAPNWNAGYLHRGVIPTVRAKECDSRQDTVFRLMTANDTSWSATGDVWS